LITPFEKLTKGWDKNKPESFREVAKNAKIFRQQNPVCERFGSVEMPSGCRRGRDDETSQLRRPLRSTKDFVRNISKMRGAFVEFDG
jgi:hypothetical protein